jgi:hypothetical protein
MIYKVPFVATATYAIPMCHQLFSLYRFDLDHNLLHRKQHIDYCLEIGYVTRFESSVGLLASATNAE